MLARLDRWLCLGRLWYHWASQEILLMTLTTPVQRGRANVPLPVPWPPGQSAVLAVVPVIARRRVTLYHGRSV